MPDPTTLAAAHVRVAADLLDELALVGAVPHAVHVFADHLVLSYLDAADRRLAADALSLGPGVWHFGPAPQVRHCATLATDAGEIDVTVKSSPDAEDFRRLAEDNETAARAKAVSA